MGIFTGNFKTFKSDITGEELTYKVNNAAWVRLLEEFKISQGQWAKEYSENEGILGSKFTYCVMKANGMDVTLEEVYENTSFADVAMFLMEFQKAAFGEEKVKGEAPGKPKK